MACSIACALGISACGSSDPAEPEARKAEARLGRFVNGPESVRLGAPENEIDCYGCHPSDGKAKGFPAHTLLDVAYRPKLMGGRFPGGNPDALLPAVNVCVTAFMGGQALAADDVPFQTIKAYLSEKSDPAKNAAIPILIEDLGADRAVWEKAYAGGNATTGEPLFKAACTPCHGRGLVVNKARATPYATLANDAVGHIAQKVRTSGFAGGGGSMPFFGVEVLPNEDLKDIIAYIKSGALTR